MGTVSTTGWGEFEIGQLFEIRKGSRLTKKEMRDGTIPFVGASAVNNGITALIANDSELHEANTISVTYNGSIGQAFYQDRPYWASDDVNVLYPKFDMTREIAFFLIPVLRAVGKNFAFVDKWRVDVMRVTKILLPQKNGQPDWTFMAEYIKRIERRVQKKLDVLIGSHAANVGT